MKLASIELRDELGERMGGVGLSHHSGWLWACSLCPAANRPGDGRHNPDTAVRHLVEHLERAHPSATGEASA